MNREHIATVDELYRHTIKKYGSRPFLKYFEGETLTSLTYNDSASAIAGIVNQLNNLGFKKNDRLACYLDSPAAAALFTLACANMGIACVPISTSVSVKATRALMDQSRIKQIFMSPESAVGFENTGITPLRWFGSIAPATLRSTDFKLDLQIPLTTAFKTLEEAAKGITSDDPYIILHTSGSTGLPKTVIKEHHVMLRVGRIRSLDLTPDSKQFERFLFQTDLAHVVGQVLLITAINLAGELVVPSKLGTAADIREIRQIDPTYIRIVPRHLVEWMKQIEKIDNSTNSKVFGPNLKIVYVGGSVIDPLLLRRLASEGIDIIEGYGSTECPSIAVGKRGDWREGYVGKVADGVQVVIEEDGEILVKSPNCFKEYEENPIATAEAFTKDGWYRTGDLGELSSDGYLKIKGRKKDVFNTYDGANIYPSVMESALERVDYINEVILIGDQRPFITALISVKPSFLQNPKADQLGCLPKAQHQDIYEKLGAKIQEINLSFEPNERVKEFVIFSKPLQADCYRTLAKTGKVSRDRKKTLETYSSYIEPLYKK